MAIHGRFNGRGFNHVVPMRATVLCLAVVVSACAGRTPRPASEGNTRADISQLWIEPSDIGTRDLLNGPGGRALAPDPSQRFEIVAVDATGYSSGFDVRDRRGTLWSVKLGKEAQSEIAVSRILWAIGYHQPPLYLVPEWQATSSPDLKGTQPKPGDYGGTARFRRDSEDQQTVGEWSWYENPFVGTREFKGLLVANLLLNNWDWKTSNNKIYEVADGRSAPRRRYIVRDLGASLGKTHFPQLLKWTPFRKLEQGSRNNIDDFEEQGFIERVDGNRVVFDYDGVNDRLLRDITLADIRWTRRLFERLSDEQLRRAFRAAGYSPEEQARFVAKLRSKLREANL